MGQLAKSAARDYLHSSIFTLRSSTIWNGYTLFVQEEAFLPARFCG
jgi:hypothetical protein